MAKTCAFRPAVLAALHEHVEATLAPVRADLDVTKSLAFAVSPDLHVVGPTTGLPQLPPFAINLHLARSDAEAATTELARHILESVTRPRQGR